MNANWPRWIFASVSKHLNAAVTTAFPMYIEGQNRNTRDLQNFFEFRMDGPTFKSLTKGSYEAYIEVNLLVQAVLNDKDYHKIHNYVGLCATYLDGTLPIFIYKLGDGVSDDQSFIGCLDLLSGSGGERLVVAHFGIVDPKTRLVQASVEAHYRIDLFD